nr:hypothetical protein [Tanacetum cinerariifolium]
MVRLGKIKKEKSEKRGRVPTEMELELEHTQQGSSYKVSKYLLLFDIEDSVMDPVTRVGDEEVVVGEGVIVTSSSLEMLTNSCQGGFMVSLIFLEGLEKATLVKFMVECLRKVIRRQNAGGLAGFKKE